MAGRRSFARPSAERQRRRVVVIAAEGLCTEPQYFRFFDALNDAISVRIAPHRGNAPRDVCRTLADFLKANRLLPGDEAWIVIDRDAWPREQLDDICAWTAREGYGFALSNPMFEFFLLLHFEEGPKRLSAHACYARLKRHLPGYRKHVSFDDFPEWRIRDAVRRARGRDEPACRTWPKRTGTTVHRLVERLLPEEEGAEEAEGGEGSGSGAARGRDARGRDEGR